MWCYLEPALKVCFSETSTFVLLITILWIHSVVTFAAYAVHTFYSIFFCLPSVPLSSTTFFYLSNIAGLNTVPYIFNKPMPIHVSALISVTNLFFWFFIVSWFCYLAPKPYAYPLNPLSHCLKLFFSPCNRNLWLVLCHLCVLYIIVHTVTVHALHSAGAHVYVCAYLSPLCVLVLSRYLNCFVHPCCHVIACLSSGGIFLSSKQ